MLEFAHAVTGGFIAGKIGNPIISLPLALLSHFAIDYLPHWNPSILKEKEKYGHLKKSTTIFIISDCVIGLILGLFMAFNKMPDTGRVITVILGCFLGILPDLVEAPFFFLKKKNITLKSLAKFQSQNQFNVSFWKGMLFQLLFVTLLLIFTK